MDLTRSQSTLFHKYFGQFSYRIRQDVYTDEHPTARLTGRSVGRIPLTDDHKCELSSQEYLSKQATNYSGDREGGSGK